MPDIPQFIIERGRAKSPVFDADEVASWPEGLLDQLIGDGVLKPAENARSFTCDACGRDHVEPVQYIQEPPGSELRAYIWCDDAGRVAIPLSHLRRWAVVPSKLLSRFVTKSSRHAALMAEVEWEGSAKQRLWAAVDKGDTATVLEVLAQDITHWAKRIKEELFDYFYGADDTDRQMCNPVSGSPLRPYAFVRPFVGTAEGIELLEFHKRVDYASRFAARMKALDDLRSGFADMVCEYGGLYGSEIALERFLELDELRKDLKGRAYNFADHILLIASQLGLTPSSAEEGNQPARRKEQKGDRSVPKRSWTQPDLDEAIRRYKAQRAGNYGDLKAGVKQGRAGAKKSAQKMFGRNAIARALGVKSTAMVSNSSEWRSIADDLGLHERRSEGGRSSRRGHKVGLNLAIEDAAEKSGHSVLDEAVRRETIRLIRERMPSREAEATIEKLERGDLSDDAARQLIDEFDAQQRDDRRRKVN